jgi:predicted RNase H-like HicB family nuclease
MRYVVELEREEDGGWLAEVLEADGLAGGRAEPRSGGALVALPGAVAFGETREEALRAAEALVLRTLADRVEHRELPAQKLEISFVAA